MSRKEWAGFNLNQARMVVSGRQPKRKALPMPYPLNDDQIAEDPEQWRDYFLELEKRAHYNHKGQS